MAAIVVGLVLPASILAVDTARSHFFIDGVDFPGLGGKAYAIDSPADGLLEGAVHDLFTEIPGDAFQFWVNPTDPDLGGDGFEVTFVAPPGEVLAVGDYEADRYPDGVSGLAYLDVDTPGSTNCPLTAASFSVHEVSYAGDGTPLAFAATFSLVCGPSNWVAGEIRFNSSVPYTSRRVTPVSLAFNQVEPGEVGPSQAVRIENAGTLPLAVTGAAVEGPFTITDDSCLGTTIDPGDGCDVMVASAPVTAGTTGGRLTISDASVGSGHRIGLSGVGFATTTTTLTSDRNPGIHPDEIATLTATVSPIPDGGRVEFCIVGGVCSQSVLVSSVTGEATMAWLKQSGTVDIVARYLGQTYFSPSASQVITQNSKRRLRINLWVDPVEVPPDHPVAVGVDVNAGSGTTTLTDELTGNVIYSRTEPSATPSFNCTFPSELGVHRIRIDHSGDGVDIVPSTTYIDVTVAEDEVTRGGPMTVPINAGDPYCMTLGVDIPSISGLANLTLEPLAVGSEEYTEVRLSNSEEVTEFGVLIDGETYPYGGSIDWSITESAGGEDADGQKTIWFQFRKASGPWSPQVAANHVYLDRTIPSGTASLAGGAVFTKSTAVTVATTATDSGSGLSQVALSNDGAAWTNRTYASSQAWTLTGGQGNKTVHVKWKDAAGNWSAPKSDTILLDSVAPAGTVAIASGATYAKTNVVTLAVRGDRRGLRR